MDSQERTRDLMSKATAGNRQAFDEAIEVERLRLAAFVRTRLSPHLRRRHDVDDILQEVFLRAFQSVDRFESQGSGSLFSWLGTIAEFLIRDLARAEKRAPQISVGREPVAEGAPPSKMLRRVERFDRLKEALETLSEEHREVVRLARVEELPVAEIAKRMQRTPGAVRHLLIRALEKLKESFGDTESLHLPERRLSDE